MTNNNSKLAFGRNSKSERKAAAPATRRGSGGMLVRIFSFMLTLALIGAVAAVGLVLHGDRQFDEAGPLREATTFEVPRGATFTSIIPGLEQKNIIPKQNILRVFLRGVQANGKASALKAGEFAFNPGMSMRQVMTELTEGQAIEYRITFPEGWTSLRMLERIAADETLTGDVPPVPPEGSLLPNTYSFGRNTTRQQAVERLMEARNKTVEQVWATRQPDLPLKSAEELVILASIIEKETGIGGERAHVASVFVNRLRKGMRLQTDPTVIYGIWGGRGKPKDRGGLRRSELDRETAYNTYKINGLPPTPIANPGLAALQAAANPLQTDDLYFVADGTGGHAFAKTLQEHNRNVANWRKIEAQRKRDAQDKPKLPATSQTPAVPSDGDAEGNTGLRLTPAPDTQSTDN
ncbi:MAG: endolytic transglycosylase MltG [Pseudomonadota bacterium]